MSDWRISRRARRFLVVSVAMVTVAGATVAGGADADAPVPVESALANQPRVMDGRVYSIDVRGDDVVVGGTFTQIKDATATSNLAQPYIFKFDVATGQIDAAFRPALNGPVEGIRYSQDGQSLFVVGDFTSVNGQTRNRVVKLNAATGVANPNFSASVPNIVKDLDLSNGRLVIGGKFRQVNGAPRERLAMLDPVSGAVLSNLNLPVTESRYDFGAYVQELEVSANGRWLVLGGNFMNVGGRERHQIAVVDLSTSPASVADWSTDDFRGDCASVYDDTWIRGIDISPDSTWFTVGTTGAHYGDRRLCDTATRWELPPRMSGSGLSPTWTTHTGGDTHWAMHITEGAVFAGGHQRWENNPHPSPGGDNDGPGSVSRPGVAALDPLTGVPLSWNPGRDRRRGIEAFANTDAYLFAGHDSQWWNGRRRERLAVVPYAGGTMNLTPDNIVLPVDLRVVVGGQLLQTRFDGASFTTPTPVAGTGVDWSEVRDGFVQRGKLHYYGPSGAFYSRSLSGNTFGSPTNLSDTVGYVDSDHDITPFDQPYGVAETTSATYSNGRIYYTKSGSSRLFWRWYSIQSGIIGAREEVASGGNFGGVRALEAVGGWLYVAQSDGTLYRAKLLSDGGVDLISWAVVDSGGSGVDWAAAESMFSTQASGPSTPPPDPQPLQCTDAAQPWRAVYHGNMTLSAPTNQRCEAAVDHDWGGGSPPGTTVGADQFSVRWNRTINVADGARLRINAGSDDGIRVYVDGELVVNDWVDRGFTSRVVDTEPLSGGDHEIVVEYYENGGGARVLAEITQVSDLACGGPVEPWSASYFGGTNLSGEPVLRRCEAAVDYDYGTGAPAGTGLSDDDYSARWTRTVDLSQPGSLRITGGSDDGMRIAVDGELVINDWFDRGYEQRTVDTAALAAGEHRITVEFYESGGLSRVLANVELPDTTPPQVTVVSPANNEVVSDPTPTFTGTATDDRGVDRVMLSVRDLDTLQYLRADGTWQATFAQIPTSESSPGGTATDWTYAPSLPLGDGEYRYEARAFDTSGNRNTIAASARFTVDQ